MATGGLAAAVPDIDAVLRPFDTLLYLNVHQGVTHSLLLLPLWALLLARLLACLPGRHPWRAFYGVTCLGLLAHIVGDAITAYGIQLFAPFSEERYALPLSYVVDPYFTTILLAGFLATWVRPRQRLAASLSLLALVTYVGVQAVARWQALEFGAAYAVAQGYPNTTRTALPQPLSPFHWKVLVRDGDNYHEALINLAGQPLPPPLAFIPFLDRLASHYAPPARARWRRHTRFGEDPTRQALAHAVWHSAVLAPFRRFVQWPSLDHLEQRPGKMCVWFADLRFTLPEVAPSFRYGACRGNKGQRWRLGRLRGSFFID
jgi:inner membrane protein